MNNKSQEIKSQHELSERGRQSEVLLKAIEKCEKLEKQLDEANNIIITADWHCDFTLQNLCGFSKYLAKYDIRQIKELDK